MEYYVVKSGMKMYDLSRAYGLGAIISKLSNSEVNIRDSGIYYSITCPNKSVDIKKLDCLSSLLPPKSDGKWKKLFSTLKGKAKIEEIKDCSRLIKNKNLIASLLEKYKEVRQPEFFHSKKKDERKTLYQSLDLSATKGFREEVRRRYHAGTQLFIPKEDFLLSVIGHLNFTIWKSWKGDRKEESKGLKLWKGDRKEESKGLIMILFNPSHEGIPIGSSPDARDITRNIDESLRAHSTGILSTLSYAAVSLAREISQVSENIRLKFSHLIFGVMLNVGEQKKPYGGGIYPLDFLYRIIDYCKLSRDIFGHWTYIFRLTNNESGYEDLALNLSEFITNPTEDTLYKYLRTHLKIFIKKDKKPKLYENDIIVELLKIV